MGPPEGLKVVSFPPGCGYGDAACEYIAGLDTLGVPVTWTPVSSDGSKWLRGKVVGRHLRDDIGPQVMNLRWRRIKYDVFLLSVPPVALHWQWLRKERRARLFTYVAWELDRIPGEWVPALNQYDGIFVPCEFNRRTLLGGGVTAKIYVVPHVVRSVRPDHESRTLGDISEDDFVFYTIGTWTTRKATEETVRAFLDTFSGGEKVALVIKTERTDEIEYHNMSRKERKRAPKPVGSTAWSLARIMAGYKNPAKVHLIAKRLLPREIDRLHTRGDCFVSLTRSEGWGLGPFDAANFGNPVIVTGWGGHCEFLGKDYPFLVDYELEPTGLAPDDGWTFHTMEANWARADMAHAGRLMRSVFENRNSARETALNLQPVLRKSYAPETVCRHMAELMGFRIRA